MTHQPQATADQDDFQQQAARVGIGAVNPGPPPGSDAGNQASGPAAAEEADLRSFAAKPRRSYFVDIPSGGRVYLRTFTALEAEQIEGFDGVEETAALMALAITDKSGRQKYVLDDPDHPEHGWRFLIDMPSEDFATIAAAIRKNSGPRTVEEAAKN